VPSTDANLTDSWLARVLRGAFVVASDLDLLILSHCFVLHFFSGQYNYRNGVSCVKAREQKTLTL